MTKRKKEVFTIAKQHFHEIAAKIDYWRFFFSTIPIHVFSLLYNVIRTRIVIVIVDMMVQGNLIQKTPTKCTSVDRESWPQATHFLTNWFVPTFQFNWNNNEGAFVGLWFMIRFWDFNINKNNTFRILRWMTHLWMDIWSLKKLFRKLGIKLIVPWYSRGVI